MNLRCAVLLAVAATPTVLVMVPAYPQAAAADLAGIRAAQREVLSGLRAVLASRRAGAEDQELLADLGALVAQEDRLYEGAIALGRETLGRRLDQLTESQRGRLDELAADQRAAVERFAVWLAGLRGREDLRAQASVVRILDLVEQEQLSQAMGNVAEQLTGNHLPQAVRSLASVSGQLRTVLEMLTNALGGGEDAAQRNLARLRKLLAEQQALLSDTRTASNGVTSDGGALGRRQVHLRRTAESIADWMTGRVPTGEVPLRDALSRMEFSAVALERSRFDESAEAQAEVCTLIEQAIRLLEEDLAERDQDAAAVDNIPLPIRRKENARRAMRMLLAGGGAGQNPLSEVLNDLNAINDLAREQKALRDRTRNGEEPTALGDAQEVLAGQAVTLSYRVAMYEPEGEQGLLSAKTEMQRAALHLSDHAIDLAVAAQDAALAALGNAHAAVKAFWDALLEAMAALMTSSEGGMPMGGGALGEERALDERVRRQLLATFKAIIAINGIVKNQQALAGRVEAASNGTEIADPQAVAFAQLEVSNRIWDLALEPDVDPHLANQIRGTWDWAMGAFIQSRIGAWSSAHRLQCRVVDGLQISTSAMADMVTKMSAETADLDTPDIPGSTRGDGASGMLSAERGAAWLVTLPPREREAIRQALAEPYPAEFEALIRAYYGQLARQRDREAQ